MPRDTITTKETTALIGVTVNFGSYTDQLKVIAEENRDDYRYIMQLVLLALTFDQWTTIKRVRISGVSPDRIPQNKEHKLTVSCYAQTAGRSAPIAMYQICQSEDTGHWYIKPVTGLQPR